MPLILAATLFLGQILGPDNSLRDATVTADRSAPAPRPPVNVGQQVTGAMTCFDGSATYRPYPRDGGWYCATSINGQEADRQAAEEVEADVFDGQDAGR